MEHRLSTTTTMKKCLSLRGWLMPAAFALAALSLQPRPASAQGTAFAYQGRLYDGGSPASGIYDLEFTLCDAASNGNCIAGPLTNAATCVTNGLFTVTLDFGPVFNGSNFWLQIAARTNGADGFTSLNPPQPLAPAPYAVYAANAASAASFNGSVPDGSLSGAYSSALTLTNAANQLGGSFAGNGAGLTNVQFVVTNDASATANFLTTNASGLLVLHVPPSGNGGPTIFVTNFTVPISASTAAGSCTFKVPFSLTNAPGYQMWLVCANSWTNCISAGPSNLFSVGEMIDARDVQFPFNVANGIQSSVQCFSLSTSAANSNVSVLCNVPFAYVNYGFYYGCGGANSCSLSYYSGSQIGTNWATNFNMRVRIEQ
jgi:hypothetical protein